ncbi:hypothetical protein KKF34_03285 [Myxococcota bacterium]|nr:hypothetical protein [Myxococcota bacterium]MBU1380671.1 hypothetical protein [Myxococcota bacterium]MBU1495879.1 hypothetical protein [Myxococcota bacterium]
MKYFALILLLAVSTISCEEERPRYPRKRYTSYRHNRYKYRRTSFYRYKPYRKYKTGRQLMEEQAAYERETKRLRTPRIRTPYRRRPAVSDTSLFRKAMASGCRRGAVYTGCHKNGWKCYRINVHTKRLWSLSAVSLKVSSRMNKWVNTFSTSKYGGFTILYLKSCNGYKNPDLPYNTCGRISASSCSSFPEFRVD